jgi:ribosomal protein S5
MCSQIVTNATGANNNKISGNCAILNALKSLRTFKEVAAVRGISVKAMLGQK